MNFKVFIQKINYTFVRFVLVGVLNTLFGIGLYCLFIYWGLPYSYAVLLSTVLGVLFNFKTIGFLVFKNTNKQLFFKFAMSYTLVYFINIGLIRLLLGATGFNEYIAGLMATPIMAIISFGLQKYFVFNKS